jgi:pyrimidine-nucleoside phosphorylase
MRAIDVIAKKRDGLPLDAAEIAWFVREYAAGSLPDYQAAALLMAIYLRGMTREETVNLTLAMAASGDQLDLSEIADYCVDKHSSGGVGDKTTLIVLPLVAACGLPVAKMSGRGLGFSGGTLDKLEAIPGFNVQIAGERFKKQAREIGLVLAGQSVALAPADGKFYALRDVTATVPSLPLIASSIMSKKLAAGAQGIVLDVKMGSGAFMNTLDEARDLARTMVNIGADAGRDVIGVISDMNQPLGSAVGNALEVIEAVETLRGGGADDLHEHCLSIAAHMLRLAGRGRRYTDEVETRALLEAKLRDGSALDKFRAMVAAQEGDLAAIDDLTRLPQARVIVPYRLPRAGWVARVAADAIAWGAFELGAGRERKEDAIDHAVGLEVHVKVGDRYEENQPLVTIHANDTDRLERCIARLDTAFTISDTPVDRLPLFYDIFRSPSAT